jgi:hypothetical protein
MARKKYGQGSQDEVRKELTHFKHGTSHNGRDEKPAKPQDEVKARKKPTR